MIQPRRRKWQSGVALLEFALATATILTVLFLIIDAGRALYAYDWVARMARQGARYAIVRGTSCSTSLPGCPATNDHVSSYVKSFASGLNSDQITVTAKCSITGTSTFSDPPCAAKGYVQVKVQYAFQFASPFFPLAWNMQSTSQQVVQH